jgi:hypothetical protein
MHEGERERERPKLNIYRTRCTRQFEECASQYPLDPTAGLVLGISNLLFWAGIIVVVAIGWIVRDWYIDRKTTRSIRTGDRKK